VNIKDEEARSTGMRSTGSMAMGREFQLEVLEKLGKLEARVEMIVGNGQPGRMRLAEDRIWALEKNDIKRATYDRIVTAAIAFGVSALITLHERFLGK